MRWFGSDDTAISSAELTRLGIDTSTYASLLEPPPDPETPIIVPVTDVELAALGIDAAWYAAHVAVK